MPQEKSTTPKIKLLKNEIVIKCKQCRDVFYIKHSDEHPCFNKAQDLFKKRKKSIEELDLTKHCGVKGCKYGLSCRSHTLEEKRQVEGRLYSLDLLVKMANEERKSKNIKETPKSLIELDNEIKNIILDIKPVVNKSWYFPRYKYENFGMKNIFYNLCKRGDKNK